MANPLVAGELGLHYAGVPLTVADGHRHGTLCIIDRVPRTLTPDELAVLQDLAAVVVDGLELRLASRRSSDHERALSDEQQRSAEDIILVTASIRALSHAEDPDSIRAACPCHDGAFACLDAGRTDRVRWTRPVGHA